MNVFFVWMVFFGISFLSASEDRPADVLYAHEEWSAALAAYEKQEDPSAGILIRMGECAARIKRYPEGLRHLYKALSKVYFLTYYNLSLQIRSLLGEAGISAAANLSPLWYIATVVAAIPPVVWQLIGLLLLIFGFWRIRFWWHERRFVSICLVIFLVVFVFVVAWWSIARREFIGGIAQESLSLRAGPDARFSSVGLVPAGTPLHIGAYLQLSNGPWYCKVVSDTQRGWVLKESVNLL